MKDVTLSIGTTVFGKACREYIITQAAGVHRQACIGLKWQGLSINTHVHTSSHNTGGVSANGKFHWSITRPLEGVSARINIHYTAYTATWGNQVQGMYEWVYWHTMGSGPKTTMFRGFLHSTVIITLSMVNTWKLREIWRFLQNSKGIQLHFTNHWSWNDPLQSVSTW